MSELEPRSRYALAVFEAEETARQLAKVLQPQPSEPRKKKTPDVKTYDNLVVNGDFDLLKLEGFEGEVEEILVESASSAFSVKVEVDGKTLWDGDYDYYNAKSDRLDQIQATLTGGYYWIHLSALPFAQSTRIKIYGSNITIHRATVKWWILQ